MPFPVFKASSTLYPIPGHHPTSCTCIHRLGLMYVARGPRAFSPSRFQEVGGLACGKGLLCWVWSSTLAPGSLLPFPEHTAPRACPSEDISPTQKRLSTQALGQGNRGAQQVLAAPPNLCPKGCKVRVGL